MQESMLLLKKYMKTNSLKDKGENKNESNYKR